MKCKTILNGFPLRTNVSLLMLAIVFTTISGVSDKHILGIVFLGMGSLLTLVAVMPSLFWYEWERVRKGKGKDKDPDTITPGWKRFCQSMGIEEDVRAKVFANLRNAYANDATIEVGQPVLDSLDRVSIEAVFAHELAHIKGKHSLKRHCLLIGASGVASLVAVLLFGVPYSSDLPAVYLFILSVLVVSADWTGIAMRFISWPFEYKADLMANQRVKQGAVASALKALAALRKMDVTRDFYGHPSINKRIANLDWSQGTRFREWYLAL